MADMPSQQANRDAPSRPSPGGQGGLRVSLMPVEGEGRSGPDLGRSLVILGIVLLAETLLILGAYFYLSQLTSQRTGEQEELRGRITAADKSIADKEKSVSDMVTFSGQVNAATEVLDGHVYWQKFFDFLEKNTTPTVRYVNFSGDADAGQVILDAVAVSYRDMAEQIVLLRENPDVESVRATSAAARISEVGEVVGVSFSMAVKFDPKLVRVK